MFSQDDAKPYCFKLEWFDANSNSVKKLELNYYSTGADNNQLEMVNQNGSKFLSKVSCSSQSKVHVTPDELYIGSNLNIYGRKVQIVDYANEHTRRTFDVQRGRTVGVVTPSGYNQLGEILIEAKNAGMVVSQMKMVKLNASQAEMYDPSWSSDVVVAMDLVDNSDTTCTENWESVCRKINQKYNTDVECASSGSSDEADAEFFCQTDFENYVAFDNCTLAIIRPEAVKRGKAGPIIDAILERGYEISGVTQICLTKDTYEKVFSAYQGVIQDYQDMKENMTSGNCIALCLRGPNVVTDFREFCGPIDVEIANELRPESLRARFGVGPGSATNALHCTDLPEDGELECKYFFQLMQ